MISCSNTILAFVRLYVRKLYDYNSDMGYCTLIGFDESISITIFSNFKFKRNITVYGN